MFSSGACHSPCNFWRHCWRHKQIWRRCLNMNDVSGCKMRYIGFNATLFLAVLSIINANAEARKIFGSDEVHIPDEVSSLVKKTLTEMNIKFDKAPLQSVEFQCKNDATEKLLSTFPNAVIRWMYNGENIKVKLKRKKKNSFFIHRFCRIHHYSTIFRRGATFGYL